MNCLVCTKNIVRAQPKANNKMISLRTYLSKSQHNTQRGHSLSLFYSKEALFFAFCAAAAA